MAAHISVVLLIILFVLLCVFCGRFFCGRICPYGLLQDLLYKIPFPKKIRSFKSDKYIRYVKYVLLVLIVAAFLFGHSTTSTNEVDTFDTGELIGWGVISLLAIVIRRPLCKYLCPAGIVLGWCNLLPFAKYQVDQDICTQCGVCVHVCKMDIEPYQTPNHIECIRCGKCIKSCPLKAITHGGLKKQHI